MAVEVAPAQNAQADERREAMRMAMKLMRLRDFRPKQPVINDERPVVVALFTDSMGFVAAQVRRAGGAASIMVVDVEKRRVALLNIHSDDDGRQGSEDGPIHVGSEIGAVIDYMHQVRRTSFNFHLVEGDATVELIEDGLPVDSLT